jgi:hypothetical protein
MPQSIAAPSPAFQPEYPAAIAPSALLPVLAPSDRFGDRSSQPDRVSVEPSSRLPYGAPPPQATSWAPPPAQAAPNRTLLFVAIGVGTVVLLVIIVLGILYYEGVFDDDDPAPVPHKSQPSKRHHPPPPAPAPRGGGSLR